MSVAYRSTCRPTIRQPLSIDISTDISVECRAIYRPICQPTYLSRYISRVSIDMSTDISFECQSKYRPIPRSSVGQYVDQYIGRGVHKIHMIPIVDIQNREVICLQTLFCYFNVQHFISKNLLCTSQ